MSGDSTNPVAHKKGWVAIHGARHARGRQESSRGSIQIAEGRITRILDRSSRSSAASSSANIDLSGFLILPGLINAHDHLDFALFPRLADPPYCNYIDWGEDIHRKFPEVIAKHRSVPKKVRVWWGGLRNLLCGVTTVCHHNPLWSDLRRSDFPVRVIQNYGWAHSPALGGDLHQARATTPEGRPFILHACEGVDRQAREELWQLDRMGLLDAATVLIHGLAIDGEGVMLMRNRKTSLIVCPSSNMFLFGKLPDLSLFAEIPKLSLGNDSPLTAEGDLLDEIRFAIEVCGISPDTAYRMVTIAPAAVLRLDESAGVIQERGHADLIAVPDTGQDAAERLRTLSMKDIEFVMIGGQVQLASDAVVERLPPSATQGLESLSVDGATRWLRAPVGALLRKTEELLGKGAVRLGTRPVCLPRDAEVQHAS